MPHAGREQRKLAAIMFTDMVGYSALAQRNEALALELLEEHRRVLRSIFPKHNGREIETAGDAFLVEFVSALEAVRCAVEIQEKLAGRNRITPDGRVIRIRIGIHVGDVVHLEGKVMGDAVNIAARIEPLASAGGICVSEDVARQIHNKLDHPLVTLGPSELKNIELPVVICRVVLPWETATSTARLRPNDRTRSRRTGLIAGSVIMAALLAGASWSFFHRSTPWRSALPATTAPPAAAVSNAPDQKSIAVLPFINISADKADEYLSDGISEEIITALSKIKGLKVPARTSCFAFKGKNEDIQKIGQQLHVGTVLEGSISKVGNKLRVTATLINIADGFNLWAETYDRALDDLLAIRTEVAARVAEALKGQLLGEEKQQLTKRTTGNAEAHRLYLKGRYLWNRRTGESLKQATEYFNQAIANDPSYAIAYAGLSDAYVLLPVYAHLPQRDSMPKARAAAMTALELDSSLAEPHAALAFIKAIFDWDWSGAEAEFRRAIELNQNYATAHHWFSEVLKNLGRFDEAVVEIRRAQEIDPLSPVINALLGAQLSAAGKEALAIEVLQKQIALDPSFVVAHYLLGDVYLQEGKLPEAIAELETMHRLDGSGTFALESLGMAYARSGRTNDSQKILDQMLELLSQGIDYRVGIALVQHALGDDEGALDSLEKAVEEHAFGVPYNLNVYPFWKDLRPHERVQAILRRMNLVK